jgi:DNA-binding XRE family transcriptional regulator
MEVTLKAARVNAEMTMADAAKALNINRNTLSNYENYKTKPDIEMSKRIADLYGCTVNDLIFFRH